MPKFREDGHQPSAGDFDVEDLEIQGTVLYLTSEPTLRSCRWLGQRQPRVIRNALRKMVATIGPNASEHMIQYVTYLSILGKRIPTADKLLALVLASMLQFAPISDEVLYSMLHPCISELPLTREAIARHYASKGLWQQVLSYLTSGIAPSALSPSDKGLVLVAMFIGKSKAKVTSAVQWQKIISMINEATSPKPLDATTTTSTSEKHEPLEEKDTNPRRALMSSGVCANIAVALLQSPSAHIMNALELKTILVACHCPNPIARKFLTSSARHNCSVALVMKHITAGNPSVSQVALDATTLLLYRFASATHRSQGLHSLDYLCVSAAIYRLCAAVSNPKPTTYQGIILDAKVILLDLAAIVNGIINRIGSEGKYYEFQEAENHDGKTHPPEASGPNYSLDCIHFCVRTLDTLCDQGADILSEGPSNSPLTSSMWLFMAHYIASSLHTTHDSPPGTSVPTDENAFSLLLKLGVKHRMIDVVTRLMMEDPLETKDKLQQLIGRPELQAALYILLAEEAYKLNIPNLWIALRSMLASPCCDQVVVEAAMATAPRVIEVFLLKCDWIRHHSVLKELRGLLLNTTIALPFKIKLASAIQELLNYSDTQNDNTEDNVGSSSRQQINTEFNPNVLTVLEPIYPSLFDSLAPAALSLIADDASRYIPSPTPYVSTAMGIASSFTHFHVFLLAHCLSSPRCQDRLLQQVDPLPHSNMTSNARVAVIGHRIMENMLALGNWSEGLRVHRLLSEWPHASKVAWQSTAIVEELTQRYLKQTAMAELYGKVTLAVRKRPHPDWAAAVEAFKTATATPEQKDAVLSALRKGAQVDTLRVLSESILTALKMSNLVSEKEIQMWTESIRPSVATTRQETPMYALAQMNSSGDTSEPKTGHSIHDSSAAKTFAAKGNFDPITAVGGRMPHAIVERTFKALAAQQPQESLKLYSKVLREEGRPSLSTLAAAAKACATQANLCWAQSLSLLKQAALCSKSRHPPPDLIATTLRTLISASRWTEAAELCQKINRSSKQGPISAPTLGEHVGLSLSKVYAGTQADREQAVILMADVTMKCLVLSKAWDVAVHHFYSLIVNGVSISTSTPNGYVAQRHYVQPSQATIEAALEACANASLMAQQVAKDVRFFAGALEDLVCVSSALIEHIIKVVEAQRKSTQEQANDWDCGIYDPHIEISDHSRF